ncbi:sodium-dependent transporter [Ruminococcus bromii]|nr:sodium-dependent transporter [Ruminococcus bromii]
MQRENFKSRTGFLLVSAGCAIGIGNVWRFPYVTGENGGGLFVLFYLAFLVLMGIPVLTMELAVGRASRKSAVLSYKTLEKPKSKWHIHGWLCMIGCYLLMMFYTPVSGWMLDYFYKFATGTFKSGMNSEQVSGVFNDLMTSPVEMIIWLAIIVVFGFFVCSRGLQKGIEKVSKVMMVALLALIVILAINSMMLSNAGEGLSFYLVPDFGKVKNVGLGKVITSAMSQAFFTLGLGIASMEIFGSYMNKDRTLYGEAVQICALDTFVAIVAGLIIFPACFSFGVQPDQGPALIFVTLPNVFVIVVFGFFVCSRGLQKGIEKVSKVMMVALLALIIILAINSMMLSNAGEGLSFYLVPDFGKVKNVGLGKVITSAMSQAFFTLGLGIASMEIFGSYMNKDRTLYGEAVQICALDTFVAIVAGLIIFPDCFSFGVQPDQGPALIFVTLPNVFVNMTGGQIWGTLFFLFMTFASFSTVIAVFENLVAFLTDTFGMSRTKASIINGIIMFFACLPCIFGFNIWSDFNILGKGVLDLEDFVVSNLLLPIGAMVYLLFCTTKFGWGFDNYFEECNTGKGLKLSRVLKPYLKYALPVLIVIVFVQGFIG